MTDEFNTPNNDPSIPAAAPQPHDPIGDAKKHAKQAADDLRAAAEERGRDLKHAAEAKVREFRATAEAKAGEFRGKAEHYYEDARERARGFQGDTEAFVREQPMKAVAYALAAGFLLGTLFKGR